MNSKRLHDGLVVAFCAKLCCSAAMADVQSPTQLSDVKVALPAVLPASQSNTATDQMADLSSPGTCTL